jgi:hypothetical protein
MTLPGFEYPHQIQPVSWQQRACRMALTAMEAKSAIYDLADDFSWETVAKEMVARMSGDEARDFLEDFTRLYAD